VQVRCHRFLKSQSPHKAVNLSSTVTDIKNKFTDLCGNWLLKIDFKNPLSEMSEGGGRQLFQRVFGQVRCPRESEGVEDLDIFG